MVAILIKDTEEDIVSIFKNQKRTYALIDQRYLCLNRKNLISNFCGRVCDTLQSVIFKNGVGYSSPFNIILSKKEISVNPKLAISE